MTAAPSHRRPCVCDDLAGCGACRAFHTDPAIRDRWSRPPNPAPGGWVGAGAVVPPVPPAVPPTPADRTTGGRPTPPPTVAERCRHEGHVTRLCSRGPDYHVRRCPVHRECSRLPRGGDVTSCGTCPDYVPGGPT